ncbi:MAG TPA: SPOR domain-containing protein [Myxococcota bacterium]|jgi:cell division septation protein DedD|nr:SPOR domain-containing protein [Myxococcota bacterium]
MHDAHRIKERMELLVEPRTIAWAVVGVTVLVGAAFAGGYHMGKAEGASVDGAEEPDVAPLNALDNLARPRKAAAAGLGDGDAAFRDLSPDPGPAKAGAGAGKGGGSAAGKKGARAAGTATAEAAPHGATAPGSAMALAAAAVVARGERDAYPSTAAADRAPGPATAASDRDLLASLAMLHTGRGPSLDDDDEEPAPVTVMPPPARPPAPPKPASVTAAPPLRPLAPPAAVTAVAPSRPSAPLVPAALPAAALAATPDDSRWTVQVGSYSTREEADEVLGRLAKKGYVPYLVTADVPGRGRWYRVRVGDFGNRTAALSMKEKIDAFTPEPSFVTTR